MRKLFEEVITAMSLASAAKVEAYLSSVEWKAKDISKALSNSDLNVEAICTTTDIAGQNLEAVQFNCTVHFKANEIPGIVAPFYCCLFVTAAYDKGRDKYSCKVGYGPRGMVSAVAPHYTYDACYLYNEFCKKNPQLDIYEFVSDDFDLRKLCRSLGVAKVTSAHTGKTIFEDNT